MKRSKCSNLIQFFLMTSLIFSTLVSQDLLAQKEQILKVAGWDVYKDPDHPNKTIGFKSFEKKYGVKIIFKPLSHLDEIIAVAESNEKQDVFIISNEGIRLLYDMLLVSPLNLAKLSHYKMLHHNLQYSEWSQFKSKIYAVPWAWGPTGLMYDQDVIKNPESWDILWNPKYKGKVAMWDDISMIWTTALALGHKNVYGLTKKQLNQVQKKLIEFNRQSPVYYEGGGDEIQLAIAGKLVAYNSWYDPSGRLKKKGKNFAMVIPKEGAVGMFDSYMISASSKEIELAHQFINHQISAPIQQQMVRITGLAPANLETLALLRPNEIKALHLDDPNYFNRMLLWNHMPRKNLYQNVLEAVRKDRSRNKK